MSFRSTFVSPGGFTTQRLDLILQKRKDEKEAATAAANDDDAAAAPPSSTASGSGNSRSPTNSAVPFSRTRSQTSENALDRWRRRMAEQRKEEEASTTTTGSSAQDAGKSAMTSDRRTGLSPVGTSTEALLRRRLDFDTSSDTDHTRRPERSTSMVNLPRRRQVRDAERRRRGGSGGGGSGGVNKGDDINANNMSASVSNLHASSASSPAWSLRASGRSTRSIGDSSLTTSAIYLPHERSLTSRRFQQLFSSSTGSDDSDDDEYPDSLDGDTKFKKTGNDDDDDDDLEETDVEQVVRQYKEKQAGPGLKRSLSSASTILRTTGWTPTSRRVRDGYDASGGRLGTSSNWAAWRSDIDARTLKKDKPEVESRSTRSKWADRSVSSRNRYNGLQTFPLGSAITNDGHGRVSKAPLANGRLGDDHRAPTGGPELTVSPPSLPTSLHLASFPGYAGRSTIGAGSGSKTEKTKRSNHWAGGHASVNLGARYQQTSTTAPPTAPSPTTATTTTTAETGDHRRRYVDGATTTAAAGRRHHQGTRSEGDGDVGTPSTVEDAPPPSSSSSSSIRMDEHTSTSREVDKLASLKKEESPSIREREDQRLTATKGARSPGGGSGGGAGDGGADGGRADREGQAANLSSPDSSAYSGGGAVNADYTAEGIKSDAVVQDSTVTNSAGSPPPPAEGGETRRAGRTRRRSGEGEGEGERWQQQPRRAVVVSGGGESHPAGDSVAADTDGWSNPSGAAGAATDGDQGHRGQERQQQQDDTDDLSEVFLAAPSSHSSTSGGGAGSISRTTRGSEGFPGERAARTSTTTEVAAPLSSGQPGGDETSPTSPTSPTIFSSSSSQSRTTNGVRQLGQVSGGGETSPSGSRSSPAAVEVGSPVELARSPRVSFSEELKVVPPSPTPTKRKTWAETTSADGASQVRSAAAAVKLPSSSLSAAAAAGATTGSAAAAAAVSGGAGRTPVKGILQNGRREGEVVHRPAPDDSEMRAEDSDADDKAGGVGDRKLPKRHSFSSSRDMRQTYRPLSGARLNPASSSTSGDEDRSSRLLRTRTSASIYGTPLTERRSYRTGKSDAANRKYGSVRSHRARSSWHERPGEASDLSHDISRGGSATAASAGQRQRRSGAGVRPYTDVDPGEQRRRVSGTEPASTANRGEHRDKAITATTDIERPAEVASPSAAVDHERPRSTMKATGGSGEGGGPGFTLSFKDFMEQRKKRGTCVLPRSAERSAEGKKDGEKTTNRKKDTKDERLDVNQNKTRPASNTERSVDEPPPAGQGAVTLGALKEIRRKEVAQKAEVAADEDDRAGKEADGVEGGVGVASEGTPESPSGIRGKKEDGTRWSFRSKGRKQAVEVQGDTAVPCQKREQSVGAVLSGFFKRSKKGKKGADQADNSVFYMSSTDAEAADGADITAAADVDDDGEEDLSVPRGPGHRGVPDGGPDKGKTPTSGTTEGKAQEAEVADDYQEGFTLGPQSHGSADRDPLSALFRRADGGDTGADDKSAGAGKDGSVKVTVEMADDRETAAEVASLGASGGAAAAAAGGAGSGGRSLLNVLALDADGSRSGSPALSAISSNSGHYKQYQKPDYKHFLDMDSLVANLTRREEEEEDTQEEDEDDPPERGGLQQYDAGSSSGISGTTGTGSGSASGVGSLEDLAMALLEAELREEGLLEGEPGKVDQPQEDYQARIQGIKTDLQKFSAQLGRALKKHRPSSDTSERAPSVSDLSVTSTRSSRSPWLRDPTADAKPITDAALRSKLKSARSPGAKVTSRDQKILELMLAKREEEKAAEAKRQAARRAWELQKNEEDAVKTTAEIKRRESLARQRQRERDMQKRRDDEDDLREGEEVLKYKENKWASQSQRLTELRQPRAGRSGSGQSYPGKRVTDPINKYSSMDDMRSKVERPWVTNSHSYIASKEKKMAERRLQNMQRKKSQEERIAAQKKEQEEMAKLVLERQERELKRANSLKETREQEQLMQKKLKNYYQKKKHDERLSDMKRKSREDISTLQAALEMKQASAQGLLQQQQMRRDGQLRKSTTDLDTRISRSRDNQQRLQEEMSSWHADLLSYRKMMEKRAEEQARLTTQQKARKAADERRHKEKLQKKNLKKLLAQEEEWKADVEASIAIKDAKARMMQMEKEETVLESRAMAAASQRMREELRSAYSSDNIDQMAKRAELEAKLGLTAPAISSTTQNMSTLTLG